MNKKQVVMVVDDAGEHYKIEMRDGKIIRAFWLTGDGKEVSGAKRDELRKYVADELWF